MLHKYLPKGSGIRFPVAYSLRYDVIMKPGLSALTEKENERKARQRRRERALIWFHQMSHAYYKHSVRHVTNNNIMWHFQSSWHQHSMAMGKNISQKCGKKCFIFILSRCLQYFPYPFSSPWGFQNILQLKGSKPSTKPSSSEMDRNIKSYFKQNNIWKLNFVQNVSFIRE